MTTDEKPFNADAVKSQPKNPLHGITLENLLNELVDHYGWEGLGARVKINCFTHDPSVKSSLKFLRKTPWARTAVETLYINLQNSPWQKTQQNNNEN
jgi:uncharacterized protein (DUF2132 family)